MPVATATHSGRRDPLSRYTASTFPRSMSRLPVTLAPISTPESGTFSSISSTPLKPRCTTAQDCVPERKDRHRTLPAPTPSTS